MIRNTLIGVGGPLLAMVVGCESPTRVDVTIPAGTTIEFMLETPLHSGTTQAGEAFEGRIHRSLAAEGRVAIPYGVKVRGSVESSESSGSDGGIARLILIVKELERNGDFYDIESAPAELVARGPGVPPEVAAVAAASEIGSVIDATSGPVTVAGTAADEIALRRGQVVAVRITEPVEVPVHG